MIIKHRVILGVLVAVVASAITSGAILAVSPSSPPDPPKGPADKALQPAEVVKLPEGTPTRDLALPYDHGRFRIIEPGTGLTYCDASPPGRSREKQVTRLFFADPAKQFEATVGGPEGDLLPAKTLDELSAHALFVDPPYVPTGWEATAAEAFTITWDDGTEMDPLFSVTYSQPRFFDITIRRFLIGDDCQFEVTDIGRAAGFEHSLTLSELRGVPVVIQHQEPGAKIQAVLQVQFITRDAVTVIEGVAIDLDELIRMAESLLDSEGAR